MARKRKTRKRVKRKKVVRKKSPFSTVMVAVIIIIIIAAIFISASNVETTIEDACINSGGTVVTSLCCRTTSDFPDMCLIGPCGCSPANSHEVNICDCGEGKCWDSNIEECVNL